MVPNTDMMKEIVDILRSEPAKPGSLERVVRHPCVNCKQDRPVFREILKDREWQPYCEVCGYTALTEIHNRFHAFMAAHVRMPND